jgi:hypothetical protein
MLTNDVNKSSRLITISEENSIRIFNRKNATQLTCVLPKPDINSFQAYSRSVDTLYILLDNKEIWIYYTK